MPRNDLQPPPTTEPSFLRTKRGSAGSAPFSDKERKKEIFFYLSLAIAVKREDLLFQFCKELIEMGIPQAELDSFARAEIARVIVLGSKKDVEDTKKLLYRNFAVTQETLELGINVGLKFNNL